DTRRHLPSATFVGIAAALLAVFTGIFIYAGIYNIAGDDPHSKPVYWVLEKLRNQSIAARARGIAVPA
ncbi:hypothetical protein NY536_05475, partial [Enterobacter hormaechei]|nr:hypothetical protein [Enterobacter hormaechei]